MPSVRMRRGHPFRPPAAERVMVLSDPAHKVDDVAEVNQFLERRSLPKRPWKK